MTEANGSASGIPGGSDIQARIDRILDEVESTPTGGAGSDAVPPVQPGAGTESPSDVRAAGSDAPSGVNPLGGLLANPELLAALPHVAGLLSPLMKNLGALTGGASPGSQPRKAPPNRHTPLIRALRPYLSPERRQAAETVLNLLDVWDTLSDMGISLTAPTGGKPGRTEGGGDP